jgi:hypothetical protein
MQQAMPLSLSPDRATQIPPMIAAYLDPSKLPRILSPACPTKVERASKQASEPKCSLLATLCH